MKCHNCGKELPQEDGINEAYRCPYCGCPFGGVDLYDGGEKFYQIRDRILHPERYAENEMNERKA